MAAIEQRRDGDVTVFVAKGTLTSGGEEGEMRRAIRTAVDQGARHIVVNLQDVGDIDSSGVAELASAHIATTNHGGSLLLCCLSKKLKHIFGITRLEDVFAIYATEAEAVNASMEKR